MLKKLTIWAIVLLVAVQVWKMPDFQEFKDRTIANLWNLAADKTHVKESSSARQFARLMKFWMEDFSVHEKDYIDKITASQYEFEQFVHNYCEEASMYHPVLSNAHLLLSCEKAAQAMDSQ